MTDIKCEYCNHKFTDNEIDEAEHHTALRKIEIKCSVCNGHATIDINSLDNGEGEKE